MPTSSCSFAIALVTTCGPIRYGSSSEGASVSRTASGAASSSGSKAPSDERRARPSRRIQSLSVLPAIRASHAANRRGS